MILMRLHATLKVNSLLLYYWSGTLINRGHRGIAEFAFQLYNNFLKFRGIAEYAK